MRCEKREQIFLENVCVRGMFLHLQLKRDRKCVYPTKKQIIYDNSKEYGAFFIASESWTMTMGELLELAVGLKKNWLSEPKELSVSP